jgi:hypothetical protein
MTLSQTAIYRSLRIAGMLLIFGLIVEAASLLWSKPLAFLLFVGVAGLATLLGLFVFLYSLIPAGVPSDVSIKKN